MTGKKQKYLQMIDFCTFQTNATTFPRNLVSKGEKQIKEVALFCLSLQRTDLEFLESCYSDKQGITRLNLIAFITKYQDELFRRRAG